MKLMVGIYAEGRRFTVGVEKEIPEMYQECFEPLKTNDDRTLAYALGEMPAGDMRARVVMKTRSDAAEVMGKEIAAMLEHEMKKHDTHNGYKRGEE